MRALRLPWPPMLLVVLAAALSSAACEDDVSYRYQTHGTPDEGADAADDVGVDAPDDVADEPPEGAHLCENLENCGIYGLCTGEGAGERCFCRRGFEEEGQRCAAEAPVECGAEPWRWRIQTTELPPRSQRQLFPMPAGSPWGAAVAVWEQGAAPTPLHFWFPHPDEPVELVQAYAWEFTAPLAPAWLGTWGARPLLVGLVPQGSGFYEHVMVAGDNRDLSCENVSLLYDVVGPQVGTWPRLEVGLLELDPALGDAPGCEILSLSAIADPVQAFQQITTIAVGIGAPGAPRERIVMLQAVTQGSGTFIEGRRLGELLADPERGGDLEGLWPMQTAGIDGEVRVGAMRAEQFRTSLVALAGGPGPGWVDRALEPHTSSLRRQWPEPMAHEYDGMRRVHLFAREGDPDTRALALYTVHPLTRAAPAGLVRRGGLGGVGGDEVWIAPVGDDFELRWLSKERRDEGDTLWHVDGATLDGGSWAFTASARRLTTVLDRLGNHDRFQAVRHGDGPWALYVEEVQQGAAERFTVMTEVRFGIGEGCP